MGIVAKDEIFDRSVVDVSDIKDGQKHYGRFLFVPSVATHFCHTAHLFFSTDASHCQGVESQRYGTKFEVVLYDCNKHLLPIRFAHFIGTESEDTWLQVVQAVKKIDGFDVEGRVTIFDQDKSIDKAYHQALSKE